MESALLYANRMVAISEDLRQIKLRPEWLEVLHAEFEQSYMKALSARLRLDLAQHKRIFPPASLIFNALERTPPENTKVIILGQDPYHGPNQAMGLSFSVPDGLPHPPSLKNIFLELHRDLGVVVPVSGDLDKWADQGVLLLNAVLTVEEHKAASHAGLGWERFTDAIIHILAQGTPKVFILWGSYAQKKAAFLDPETHLVLKAPHPSPLSAHRGFFGSRPFSKANAFLKKHGLAPIDWDLTPKPGL